MKKFLVLSLTLFLCNVWSSVQGVEELLQCYECDSTLADANSDCYIQLSPLVECKTVHPEMVEPACWKRATEDEYGNYEYIRACKDVSGPGDIFHGSKSGCTEGYEWGTTVTECLCQSQECNAAERIGLTATLFSFAVGFIIFLI